MPVRSKVPSWGIWIRDYLSDKGEDYLSSIHQAYCDELKSHGYSKVNWRTFSSYIWILVQLNLIVRTREEQPQSTNLDASKTIDKRFKFHQSIMRHYYTIVAGKENAMEWDNPRRAWEESR